MSLFRFNWLYRIVRRRTKPIPESTASLWKQRLSILYMITAWNALGVLAYLAYYKKKGDWSDFYGLKSEEERNKKPAEYFAELLGMDKAHVVSYKKFTKVDEYDYVKPGSENEPKVMK